MLRGRGEGLMETSCKVNSTKSSHQLSMVSMRMEKRFEACLLEMKKKFQLHDYPLRVETIIETYHLQGKETM
jgi:hypothetical protein